MEQPQCVYKILERQLNMEEEKMCQAWMRLWQSVQVEMQRDKYTDCQEEQKE